MAFDFKKEYKEFYLPKRTPELVTVPPMTFVAVRGEGDPNVEGGAYKEAVGVLYAIAYTIKMSKMGDHRIDGYYDFVVPPLEGFWWQPGVEGVDFANKATFHWIAAIRLPDFVTPERVRVGEGRRRPARRGWIPRPPSCWSSTKACAPRSCIWALTTTNRPRWRCSTPSSPSRGSKTICRTAAEGRHHHEIYLSDPRRTAPEKLKTVLRHPVRARD